MMEKKIDLLKRMVEESTYTVALCGSGMMEEGGFRSLKNQERAYSIEERYGRSPEELFTGAYYSPRPEEFFRFYKEEILKNIPRKSDSVDAMAAMERAGKPHGVITANAYAVASHALKNVVELHGNIYENRCSRCGRSYPMEYVRDAAGVPLCVQCQSVVRPHVTMFGEMLDARLIERTSEEIEKAQLLLVLGTTLHSEVFRNYIRYFNGKYLAVIHERADHEDYKADLVILDQPRHVLPQLGY